jgi:hypothetical protein
MKKILLFLTLFHSLIVAFGCDDTAPHKELLTEPLSPNVISERILQAKNAQLIPPLLIAPKAGLPITALWGIHTKANNRYTLKILHNPLDFTSQPMLFDEEDPMIYWSAASDSRGKIWIAWRTHDRNLAEDVVKVSYSSDDGQTWSTPTQIFSSHWQIILQQNSLVIDPNNNKYLITKGVRKGSPLSLIRQIGSSNKWEDLGTIPGTDDRSTFDRFGVAANEKGHLAICLISFEGDLIIQESQDGGTTWTLLKGLKLPGKTLWNFWKVEKRNRMPDIMYHKNGLAVTWGVLTSEQIETNVFKEYVDLFFSMFDSENKKWIKPVSINDIRNTAEIILSLGDIHKSTRELIKRDCERSRPVSFRYPSLFITKNGHMVVLWRQFRNNRLALVMSISDQNCLLWSPNFVLNEDDTGDICRFNGYLHKDFSILTVVYNQWPDKEKIEISDDLKIKAFNIQLF